MKHALLLSCLLALPLPAADPGLSITWIDEPARVLTARQQTTLRVRVTDASGAPAAAVPVGYLAPVSGPTGVFLPWDGSDRLSAASTVTDSDGIAAVLFEAGAQAGPYLVEMRLESGRSVTFGMANVPLKAPAPAMAASAARRALEKKFPATAAIHGPVWLPAFTTVVSAGPPSVYATAAAYSTQSTGTWLFWIDLAPDQLFGHPVQYVTADVSRVDMALSLARYTREIWWPAVRLIGSSGPVALLPPSLTAPPPPSPAAAASASGAPAGVCAIVAYGPAAPGASANAARTAAFYLEQGIADAARILVPEGGLPATRDGLAALVQQAAGADCQTVYFSLTANGFPPRAARSSSPGVGLGGVVLSAADGAPSDFVPFNELAAALLPLKGKARIEAAIEASYAAAAGPALSGLGLGGDLLAGADDATPQSSGADGTPLSTELLRLWKQGGSFAEAAAQAARAADSPLAARSHPRLLAIAEDGPRALAVPSFNLPGPGAFEKSALPLPEGLAAGTALTARVSIVDPRIGNLDVAAGPVTVGQPAPALTVYGGAGGSTRYTLELSGDAGTRWLGSGAIGVGQEVSCSPSRITLTEFGKVAVHVAPGPVYDALYNGTVFTAQTLDERVIRLATPQVSITDPAAGADLNLVAVAPGNTTVEVRGTRAFGPAYTACVLDVTIVPAFGTGTLSSSSYLVQTDPALERQTMTIRGYSESMVEIAVPAVQENAASGSELVCAVGTVPKYPVAATTSQAPQKTVQGNYNAHALCAWTAAGGAPLTYQFSTFLGTLGNDAAVSAVNDAQGNLVVVGMTDSTGLPVTAGGRGYLGKHDLFVAKISRFGDRLIFATYFGGTDEDIPTAVAVDPQGNVYVTGYTTSFDFPTSINAVQVRFHGGAPDAFVVKLDGSTGVPVWATLFGGGGLDVASAIAVDGDGAAYIAGQTTSRDLPVTPGAFQAEEASTGGGCIQFNGGVPPCADAFVAKLAPDGGSVMYATYLGGTNYDYANTLAIDAAGNAYVAGGTSSADFPTTPGAYQPTLHPGVCSAFYPCADAFVAVLNPTGTALIAATLLGGEDYDDAKKIAVDASGTVYVTGTTRSQSFPVTRGAFQPAFGGGATDAFVAVLSPGLKLLRAASYYGGTGDETAASIALGRDGRVYFGGDTSSKTLP